MKNLNINPIEGLEELSRSELTDLSGGETIWYWIAYGVAAAGKKMYENFIITINDPRVMDSAMFY